MAPFPGGEGVERFQNILVIPRLVRGTHLSAARAEKVHALTWKLNPGSRA